MEVSLEQLLDATTNTLARLPQVPGYAKLYLFTSTVGKPRLPHSGTEHALINQNRGIFQLLDRQVQKGRQHGIVRTLNLVWMA